MKFMNIQEKLFVLFYIMFLADNACYFYLGCLKAIGYLINPTILTFILFYFLDNCVTYILAFKLKMEIKGIWISLSIGATIGAIVFIYWIFSFDMSEMKKIALKRIEDDKKNLEYFIKYPMFLLPYISFRFSLFPEEESL